MADDKYDIGCPINRENELWSHSTYYDEKCEGCRDIVQIGTRKFCGKTPGRTTLHQVIRSQMGCVFCKNYTKHLDSAVCLKCLEDRPNAKPFELDIGREEALLEWNGMADNGG